MRLIVCILFPWFGFFTIGQPLLGIVCLLLQMTLVGWLPAVIWSVHTLSQYENKMKTRWYFVLINLVLNSLKFSTKFKILQNLNFLEIKIQGILKNNLNIYLI